MELTPTMEDYIKAIHDLAKKKRVVRPKDIADKMRVKMSSVTNMLSNLSKRGFIIHEKYEHVELTDEGKKVALQMDEIRRKIKPFFVEILGLDEAIFEEEICSLEHILKKETIERIKKFSDFLKSCPRAGKDFVNCFLLSAKTGFKKENCILKEEEFLENYRKRLEVFMKDGIPLTRLSPGEKGKVKKILGPSNIKKRMLDMGIISSELIEVERVAPLGDPIEIKVKGYHLSLRKDEAENILIEKI